MSVSENGEVASSTECMSGYVDCLKLGAVTDLTFELSSLWIHSVALHSITVSTANASPNVGASFLRHHKTNPQLDRTTDFFLFFIAAENKGVILQNIMQIYTNLRTWTGW